MDVLLSAQIPVDAHRSYESELIFDESRFMIRNRTVRSAGYHDFLNPDKPLPQKKSKWEYANISSRDPKGAVESFKVYVKLFLRGIGVPPLNDLARAMAQQEAALTGGDPDLLELEWRELYEDAGAE